ncbi:hypothetical protein OED01_06810 [Microbacterium sp. M28]|uniref:hypothetical protein n=1 Tax=Microbacterium sp. M28 TaxID=2962064 RepID=UPI0021F49717|nr:hypothetical protein [Microbacterium sp. M28]UYO98415.1 hypothetical protein OED01_06810 [Microbacterium sp. M28]
MTHEQRDQEPYEQEEVPPGGEGADSGAVDAVGVSDDHEGEIPDQSPQNDIPGVGTRRAGR